MHLPRDNPLVSILNNLNECTATKTCSREARVENGAAPLDISQNDLRSNGGIEPFTEKGIVYERANANNVNQPYSLLNERILVNTALQTFPNLPSTPTPELDPWTDYNNYKRSNIIPTVYVALGVPLVLLIVTLVAVTLVALHKRYKRGNSGVPQQSTSRLRVPEMEASHTIPQELAADSWAEHGISAREGTKELEGPNCQRIELMARESVAQEMRARESVAKELDVEAIYGDMDVKNLPDEPESFLGSWCPGNGLDGLK
ncbi:MAG: hypothetical protein LQ342_001908 [Letrouitia transgressa]|nr:MAG: hypothetical protein LQ342_001908 [Letrouitia transgressa]